MPDETIDDEKLAPDNFVGPMAATLAVAIFLFPATLSGGWFEAAFGKLAPIFWSITIVWAIASTVAVCRRKHWWVVATAPFAFYSEGLPTLLVAACMQGNCI